MRDFSIDLLWARLQIALTAAGGWLGYMMGGPDGLLLALIVCGLSGCGGSQDEKFPVDFVAQGSGSVPILIVGQYKGKQCKMSAAFKDCTLTEAEYLDGEGATLSGTAEGYLKIDGGVRLTLKDADGATHTVEVKDGTQFSMDTSNKDAWRFLLPD